jgi:hypothetical protein
MARIPETDLHEVRCPLEIAGHAPISNHDKCAYAPISHALGAVLRVIIAAGVGRIAVVAFGGSEGLFVALAAALVVYLFAIVAVAGGAWFDTVKKEPLPAVAHVRT